MTESWADFRIQGVYQQGLGRRARFHQHPFLLRRMTGSIRNKILVVFYLSSVLSLLGYILIYLLSQQQGELIEDSAQIPPVTEAWFRLNNGMHHAVSSQREWLLSGNSFFREGRLTAWDKEIDPALQELDRLYKASRLWQDERHVETRTFYDIRLLIRNLRDLQQQVEVLTFRSLASNSSLPDRQDNDWRLANDMMVNQILPLQLNIENAIATIVRWQSDFSRQNTLQIRNEVLDLNIRILFIALAVFLFGWILSRLLGAQIARSLQELRDAVRRVKDDNFDGQIEISTQDEIGELAEEFREMLIAIQQRTQQLRNSFAELERATQTKSEFLTNMSHELRTPLNAIIGFADALLEDDETAVSDYQHDRLGRIRDSGQQLLEMINSLLDLSRMEAGQMQLHFTEFAPREVAEEVLGLLEPLTQRKHLQAQLIAQGELFHCRLDRDKLRQMLINLLGNAIKFTPEGGAISVTLSRQGDHFRLAVHDTGIGIAPEHLDRIFQAFQQVDSSVTRSYAGTGLGLALVQLTARLLQGRIEVQSQVSRGSTFTLHLPLDPEGTEASVS